VDLSDLFISHASEDKDAIARPLAEALRERGWSIWFDEFELALGDRLREKIDQGLAEARFGLVILSPSFFSKRWPRRELDGLTAREIADPERKVILPVWHEVDRDYVSRFSPPLADVIAVRSSDPLETIVDGIEFVLRTESATASAPMPVRGGTSPASRRPLSLQGPALIQHALFVDERGFFAETYRADEMAALGVTDTFVQINQSRSTRGVLRGMHFEVGAGQAKLVRCARGAIYDVIVDLRRSSATYASWEAVRLDDERGLQLYVPVGFAHGFCVLSEVADVVYSVSTYYNQAVTRGFRWNDPDVRIAWPDGIEFQLSEPDATAPLLRDIADDFQFRI
jgi:dTDP-4-dehydrorhamnose 3,5-epimerase